MPTDGLTVIIRDNEINKFFERIKKETSDFTAPLKEVAASIQTLVDLGFRDSKDPFGKAWKPLKRRRKRSGKKDAPGRSEKPLIDTTTLFNSVTSDGEGAINEVGKTFLRFGTALEYAATHNYGDGGRNIPQRQFLPDGDNFPVEWLDQVEEDILGGFDFLL